MSPPAAAVEHSRIDYRLGIRQALEASGLLDEDEYVTLAPTHLEILRAASARPSPLQPAPRTPPPWNARHNGAFVSLLVRCAAGVENGLTGSWNDIAAMRDGKPASWRTAARLRVRANALEKLAASATSDEKLGIVRQAGRFAESREGFKLVLAVINLSRERLGLEALEAAAAPITQVTKQFSSTGLYLCIGRRQEQVRSYQPSGRPLWVCETVGPTIPGEIGEALGRLAVALRYDLRKCAMAKARMAGGKAARWTTIVPRPLLARGAKSAADPEIGKLFAAALARLDDVAATASAGVGGGCAIAFLWRNQSGKRSPGIAARELEAIWRLRESFDEETKRRGVSRRDWMIAYKAKVRTASLYRLDDHEVWARTWSAARRTR